MNPSSSILDKEPATIAGVVLSAITVGIAFGAPISPDQKAVLQGELPIIIAGIWGGVLWIRSQVFSPHTVENVVKPAAFVAGAAAAQSGTVAEVAPTFNVDVVPGA